MTKGSYEKRTPLASVYLFAMSGASMALIACSECKKQISSKAEACPHCGARAKKKPSGCAPALLVGGLIVILIVAVAPDKPDQRAPVEDSHASAKGACMLFIKQRLHDPDSSKFESSDRAAAHKDGDTWIVTRAVFAKNAFNATRKAQFICRMRLDAGTWQPISITELNH